MGERRPLRAGINIVENADPEKVEAFIRQVPMVEKPQESMAVASASDTGPKMTARPFKRNRPLRSLPIGLIPVTVRLRPEIAAALKRAALERELAGIELHTQQEIVENALEPWLRSEGVLDE